MMNVLCTMPACRCQIALQLVTVSSFMFVDIHTHDSIIQKVIPLIYSNTWVCFVKVKLILKYIVLHILCI